MPPRPRLRSVATATTSFFTPQRHAALQSRYSDLATHHASQEPVLDFLCPAFGFFSRCLPTTSSAPPTPPPASTHFPRASTSPFTLFGGLERAKGNADTSKKCPCGRLPQSCSRCRSASTSAVVRPAPSPRPPKLVDPPIPPPSPPPLERSFPSDSRAFLVFLSPKARKYDALLKDFRHPSQLSLSVSPRSSGRRKGVSKDLTVAEATNAASTLEVEVRRALAKEGIQPRQKLDLIRLLARAGYGLRMGARKFGEEEAEEPEVVAETRERVGNLVADLLHRHFPPSTTPHHPQTQALLHIVALDLQSSLPPVTPLNQPEIRNSLTRHLRTLFLSSTSTTPSSRFTQHTALHVLFAAWGRTTTGAEQALHLIHFWKLVSFLHHPADKAASSLLQTYGELLSRLPPTPDQYFTSLSEPERSLDLGQHLIDHLALSGSPSTALLIWDSLRPSLSLSKSTPPSTQLQDLETSTTLLSGLLRFPNLLPDTARLAIHIERLLPFTSLSSSPSSKLASQDAYEVLAKLAGREGDQVGVERAVEKLEKSASDGRAGLKGAALKIEAAARRGDVLSAREVFDSVRGVGAKEERERLYGSLVGAYTRVNQVETAVALLEEMKEEDLRPTTRTLNRLLAAYAVRSDEEGVYAVFGMLDEGSLSPSTVSFNALATLHSNLRDPDGVLRVMEDMKRRGKGCEPDRFTWTALMNAYLAVGEWKAPLEIYQYLQSASSTAGSLALKPDVAVTNTILKASVVFGAPAQTTLGIFKIALERGLQPTVHTYSHVMLALCTAGMMDLAEELFEVMDERLASSSSNRGDGGRARDGGPDVQIFSMLMYGYLQAGESFKARGCLREMQARDIRPSSITYAIIIASFLRDTSASASSPSLSSDAAPTLDTGIDRALSLAKSFLQESPLSTGRKRQAPTRDLPLARSEELLVLFVPIVHALAKRADASLALEYFRQVMHLGVTPNVQLYTALMDAYRRAGDTDNAVRVWEHLHSVVLESMAPGKGAMREESRKAGGAANLLCRPLTVYLSALLASNRLKDVSEAWKRHSSEGFAFDASNWNVFAVAACRAGKLRLAFWISEVVLSREEERPLSFEELDRLSRSMSGEDDGLSFDLVSGSSKSSPLELSRSRLYQGRKRERAQLLKLAPTLDKALDSAPRQIDLHWTLELSDRLRRRASWHPHAAFLRELKSALEDAAMEGGERRQLERAHPRTMQALYKAQQPSSWRRVRGSV